VVAHEQGAVQRGASVLTSHQAPCTLNKLPWNGSPHWWFVMVCACSLRTQQCAEMLVPCFFVLFFCCASVWLVISAMPYLLVSFSVEHSMESLILAQDERWRRA
jgi:hypothetical protein